MSTKESPLFRLRNFISEEVYRDRKVAIGRILTVVDAIARDSEQRKAMKDIIEEVFYSDSTNRANRQIRLILLEFAHKFCKPEVALSSGDEASFLGRYPSQLQKTDYFK